jgi:YhcH/YjgK/YiaL family protein
VTEYDKAGDYQFFKVDGAVTDIIVPAGFAAIFFPGEAHRPCCTVDGIPAHVRKLVFKVRMP